jgi:hypothetical protein
MNPSADSRMSANQPVKSEAFSREASLYLKGATCIPQSIGTTRVHKIYPIGDPITVKLTGPYPDGGAFKLSDYSISGIDETEDDGSSSVFQADPTLPYVGNMKAGGGCVAFGKGLGPKDEEVSVAQWAASFISYGSLKIAEHATPNMVDGNESDGDLLVSSRLKG